MSEPRSLLVNDEMPEDAHEQITHENSPIPFVREEKETLSVSTKADSTRTTLSDLQSSDTEPNENYCSCYEIESHDQAPGKMFETCVAPKKRTSNNSPSIMKLEDKESQSSVTKADPEKITPYLLYKDHILRGDSLTAVGPCSVIVSGTKGSGHLSMMRYLFNHVIKTKDGKTFFDFEETAKKTVDNCLYNCVLIIVGQHRQKAMKWLISSEEYAIIFCLLAYFVNIYKERNYDSFEQLVFVPAAPNEEFSDPSVKEQVQQLHSALSTEWEKLRNDEPLRNELLNGVTLINVFGIDHSKSMLDFLPFLNKYCKRSMHLTCYNVKNDAADLEKESIADQHCNQDSKSNQLFKQLKGCVNEEQIVVETIITDSACSESTAIDKLQPTIKENVRTKRIHRLQVSKEADEKQLEHVKKSLEKLVGNSSFHSVAYLRELLLLQAIKKKQSKSFWMRRTEMEPLATQLKFFNSSFDRFLQFFTTFGSIFYTHNIPALDEYIITDIVKFVERIHQLYSSDSTGERNQLAKYGLFEYTDNDEDREIIFKFLVVLGIAVKVCNSQIILPSDELLKPTYPYYCYIPSARSAEDSTNTDEDLIVISFNESVAENLQALMCKEVLCQGGYLEATKTSNSTTVIEPAEVIMIRRSSSQILGKMSK